MSRFPPTDPRRTRVLAALLAGVVVTLTSLGGTVEAQRRSRSARALVRPRFQEVEGDDPAREHFIAGVTLYQGGDRDGAVEQFVASFELRAEPVVAYNLGQVLRELHRYEEAVDWYTRYLETADEHGSRGRRRRVEALVRRLSRVLVPLSLQVAPEGATVMIDGRDIGVAPFVDPVLISPGDHRVTVSAERHITQERSIHVQARRALELSYALERERAVLRVTADPPQATIFVDGMEVGAGEVERDLDRGSHVVEVVHAEYMSRSTTVHLGTTEEMDLRLVLEPEPRHEEVWETWWFWTLVGVAVAGAAAGTAVGIVASP